MGGPSRSRSGMDRQIHLLAGFFPAHMRFGFVFFSLQLLGEFHSPGLTFIKSNFVPAWICGRMFQAFVEMVCCPSTAEFYKL